jgi:methylated-DNA-[protein]-cysteine S-methyltransferase
VRRAAEGVAAIMRGEADIMLDVPIDYEGVADLPRRVYEVTRAIPPGKVLTYGEVAVRIGEGPQAAQAVGQALGKNPFAPVVPCHRVVGAGGKLVGFSASGGTNTKLKLLEIEGATSAASLPLFAGLG